MDSLGYKCITACLALYDVKETEELLKQIESLNNPNKIISSDLKSITDQILLNQNIARKRISVFDGLIEELKSKGIDPKKVCLNFEDNKFFVVDSFSPNLNVISQQRYLCEREGLFEARMRKVLLAAWSLW